MNNGMFCIYFNIYITDRKFCQMNKTGTGSLFQSGGGGQDSTGAMPRRQAGFYPVIFLASKKGGAAPCSAVPVKVVFPQKI